MTGQANKVHNSLEGEGHPSLEQLAALAEGCLEQASAERVREHLATCVSCLDAYIAAADACLKGDSAAITPTNAELLALGKRLASGLPEHGFPGRRVGFLSRPSRPATRWRLGWGIAPLGVVAVVLAVVLLRAPEVARPPSQFAGVELAPLQEALREMSAPVEGALIPPGGEAFADAAITAPERSGGVSPQDPVGETLARLEDLEAKGGLFSPQLAYWLGVAYLAVGDLSTARIHLDQALRRFPNDTSLRLLAAVRANRSNELAAGEQQLRQLLEHAPRNRLVQLDLGILLARDPQRRSEAAEQLEAVVRHADGPLVQRARMVLHELETASQGGGEQTGS